MTSWIIGAVVIGVFVLGVFGAIRSHDNKIRAEQKAEDVAAVVACQANNKTLIEINATNQKSLEALNDQYKLQGDRMTDLTTSESRAKERAAQLTLELAAKRGPARAVINADKRELATTRAGKLTCEQTMANVKKTLRGAGDEQLLFWLGLAEPVERGKVNIK